MPRFDSDADSTVWINADNNHETGEVVLGVWSRGEPPAELFRGRVVSFRSSGDDAVVELKRK